MPSPMRKPPVHFSQPLFDEICSQLAAGRTLRAIERMDGMPTAAAVIHWVHENLELNKQYTRAREIGYTLMADDIIEISDTPVLTEHGDTTDRSRLRVESRKWLLSKALPKVYGDKQSVEGKFTVDWAQVCQEAADKWKAKHGGQDS
jgi:hypothetical protein